MPGRAIHALEFIHFDLQPGNSIMNKRSPNEFQRDMEMRQRNIVYPDTLRNEIRGWRGLITSKEPLSALQVVGLLTFYLAALTVLFVMGREVLSELRQASGPGVRLQVLGIHVISFVLMGAVFLLLRWRVRKALGAVHKRPRAAK